MAKGPLGAVSTAGVLSPGAYRDAHIERKRHPMNTSIPADLASTLPIPISCQPPSVATRHPLRDNLNAPTPPNPLLEPLPTPPTPTLLRQTSACLIARSAPFTPPRSAASRGRAGGEASGSPLPAGRGAGGEVLWLPIDSKLSRTGIEGG